MAQFYVVLNFIIITKKLHMLYKVAYALVIRLIKNNDRSVILGDLNTGFDFNCWYNVITLNDNFSIVSDVSQHTFVTWSNVWQIRDKFFKFRVAFPTIKFGEFTQQEKAADFLICAVLFLMIIYHWLVHYNTWCSTIMKYW